MIIVLAVRQKFVDLWKASINQYDIEGREGEKWGLIKRKLNLVPMAREKRKTAEVWLLRALHNHIKGMGPDYAWREVLDTAENLLKMLRRYAMLDEHNMLEGQEKNLLSVKGLPELAALISKERESIKGFIRTQEVKLLHNQGGVMVLRAKTKAAAQFLAKDTALCIGWGHPLGKHPERECRYDADYGPDRGHLYFIVVNGSTKYSMFFPKDGKKDNDQPGMDGYVELRNEENGRERIGDVAKRYRIGKVITKIAKRLGIDVSGAVKALSGAYTKVSIKNRELQLQANSYIGDSSVKDSTITGSGSENMTFSDCFLTNVRVREANEIRLSTSIGTNIMFYAEVIQITSSTKVTGGLRASEIIIRNSSIGEGPRRPNNAYTITADRLDVLSSDIGPQYTVIRGPVFDHLELDIIGNGVLDCTFDEVPLLLDTRSTSVEKFIKKILGENARRSLELALTKVNLPIPEDWYAKLAYGTAKESLLIDTYQAFLDDGS